ncbi:lipopolysaccharide-induced tumor necrosis factor-alpha factor homolog [Anopheles arabiensis]|uniref:AGAP009053-PA n=7 Tax=Cellia TaxID=44534 RepID=Q7PW85_ANOGA|nr:lipopolysaccharide-induced tumor necrosis factor-alpha factor homolog [Anopheles arabiensis]XP_040237759.2 lipopolysaccharide-induced tumor necrosis factor-alpha factor homolog [Anopheles coluzzii]XP_041776986.1 lipopolysaccharide-induced tumor necrosis factor-alpha factor homolog [Anopheles merus]XP_319805.4 lipopolysaccharide-induced tumor necrosis factor-alpha factor homolog [Anopheles gambiae]EAA15026.4 AGAP009053-PA [Anopheles gambiae str. PEST]
MTTIIVTNPQVGPDPMTITCPTCHATVRTKVKHESTTSTHACALLLWIVCWPCLCLPYCCNSCRDANHYCPRCNTFIGSYKH